MALDPFPYHGTMTTCEALWMGVPVVSLAGRTHVSRVGVSLLNAAGMGEWIARSPEHYVDLAATLAGDLPRLAALRSEMRGRLQQSPLMDVARSRGSWSRHIGQRGTNGPLGDSDRGRRCCHRIAQRKIPCVRLEITLTAASKRVFYSGASTTDRFVLWIDWLFTGAGEIWTLEN